MSATRAVGVRRAPYRSTAVRRPTGQRRIAGPGLASRVAPIAVILLGASMYVAGLPASAAQGPVGLGTADSFAVLAGSAITNTGPTTITGDVGAFPTPSETGFGSITLSGTNHDGDAVTQGAKNDLVAAYNDAFGRTPVTNLPVELGGSTLLAGVYTSPTFGLTGTLTLDAQGSPGAEFIFQAGSTVITASNSRVLLVNGADPCHVVWQVGSSATFNTGTQFVGDVLAQTSITAQTGATFQGRLLARDGAVTLDTNTITKTDCVAPTAPSTTSTTVGTTSTTFGTTPTTLGTTPTTVSATPTTIGTPTTTPRTPPTTAAGSVSSIPGSIPRGGPGASTPGAASIRTPGPISPGAGPASPTGTREVAPRPPAGAPGRPPPGRTPGTHSTPPFLAFTGLRIVGLVVAGLALLALGAGALVAGRRRRKARVAQQ